MLECEKERSVVYIVKSTRLRELSSDSGSIVCYLHDLEQVMQLIFSVQLIWQYMPYLPDPPGLYE